MIIRIPRHLSSKGSSHSIFERKKQGNKSYHIKIAVQNKRKEKLEKKDGCALFIQRQTKEGQINVSLIYNSTLEYLRHFHVCILIALFIIIRIGHWQSMYIHTRIQLTYN